MKIRFQADVDLNQIIVKAIIRQQPSLDFQTAQAANLNSLTDLQVLAVAASTGRVLVTHDSKTMPIYFAEFIVNEHSSGVVVVPQKLSIGAIVDDLILIWSASEAEEWIDRIQILPL